MARGIADAYLKGELGAFFGTHPANADDRRKVLGRVFRPVASAVADELQRQNAAYAPSAARDAHLAALRQGAAAVVTGQQVGLFLGPLYTVYKAASAVRIAKALAAESGRPVVPVFWLQAEDHDLPEIAGCTFPTPRGSPLSVQLPASANDRVAVAHLKLPAEIEALHAQLRAELGALPHAEAHLARLARHYRAGAGWVEAFAGVIAELFADDGLVLVNPRVPVLASAAAELHRQALLRADQVASALLERSAALEQAGFNPAVHVRASSPLSFFHPEGAEGPRYRLEATGAGYSEIGGTRQHTREQLLTALDRDPLTFSTSALLRPILQDTLLPTVAYVGGPGELAYFAQLAPLYRLFDRPMPLVVPRARFRVIDGETRSLLRELAIAADDAALPLDALLARCAQPAGSGPSSEEIVQRLLAPFQSAMAELEPTFAPDADALSTPIRKTRSTVERAIRKLAGKYEAAQRRGHHPRVDDVRRVQQSLSPGGAPQERVHGLAYYAAKFGERAFLDCVLDAVRPFDGSSKDLQP